MDTRGIQESPGSLYVSSPESSPPPSPERSPGVGLSRRGPTNLVSTHRPLAAGISSFLPSRHLMASEMLPAMRPSWLGPTNTGHNNEVSSLLEGPGVFSEEQEEGAHEAAEARYQANENTHSAMQTAQNVISRPLEPPKGFRPIEWRRSTPRAMGGRRRKKTLKVRKTKNNRRRRASKTR